MVKINNKKIIINALSSVLQVVITGVIYFFLYRYLVKHLGPAQLGVWSLVLATSSIANLANFGITSGLVKFVAEYKANQKENELSLLVSTTFITICFFFSALILVLYIVAVFILKRVIDANYLKLAEDILPFSLLSLFINGVGGVFTSVLEGLQKNYLRNIIYSTAILLFFLLTLILAPIYGLRGVAFAQVAQAAIILVSAFALSFKYFYNNNNNNVGFFVWKRSVFKEIMSYGLKFQLVSIFQMLFEPTTKALLSRFGGINTVGYYEMASRMVTQFRALIVNANQVMIPVVTTFSINNKSTLQSIYFKTLSLTISLTLIIFLGVILYCPLISMLWIGEFKYMFVMFVIILSLSNLFNILSVPAFFGFLGQGQLNTLIISQFLTAILNFVLPYSLGVLYQGYGVVYGWAISLAIPSLYLFIIYNKKNLIPINQVINNNIKVALSFLIFLIFFLFFLNTKFSNQLFKEYFIETVIVDTFIVILFMWLNYKNNKDFKKLGVSLLIKIKYFK